MPSEKKSKRNKGENKTSSVNEPLKPLAHYVGDRLELTKQLFSCLKNSQIKQRLPANLQNKSIERIQQICLDEILGVSTKRLVSIINNTKLSENTDSDSDIDEHISLEEISSDSGEDLPIQKASDVQKRVEKAGKKAKDTKDEKPKTPKEMTMLELLELQARARAIRSQLALEPVTKIELDSDDEVDEKKSEISKNVASTSKASVNGKSQEHLKETIKDSENSSKASAPQNNFAKQRVLPPSTSKPKPAPVSKPLKLKRNYKSNSRKDDDSTSLFENKAPSSPKVNVQANYEDDDDEDVIRMDQSPETFFISDSDDEPPSKKTPEKEKPTPLPEVAQTSEKEVQKPDELQPPEDGEICGSSSKENSPELETHIHETVQLSASQESSPVEEQKNENANEDDAVHLMSDTEIELHHQEEDEVVTIKEKKTENVTVKISAEKTNEKPDNKQVDENDDDDVVEIHNSSDDDMMNESDKSAGEAAQISQTWEQRWLSSSKTQNILKTTQLASKVRVNMLKTKKSQKASEKKKSESEKSAQEKASSIEEGSMEQFKVIGENSNSSVN